MPVYAYPSLPLFMKFTKGFSGSDIRELIRVAAVQRNKVILTGYKNMMNSTNNASNITNISQTIKMEDFYFALGKTQNSMGHARQYSADALSKEYTGW